MVDTAVENKEFTPQPLRPASEVSQGPKEQSKLWKIAHKFGLAGLAASIGIAGTSIATDQTPLEVTQDAVGHATDAVSFTADRVEERVEAFNNNWKNGTPDPNDPRNR